MTTLTLDELGPPQRVALSATEGRALAGSGVVDAQPDPDTEGVWWVRAAGRVGVARIGAVEVWVRPKVPIERLLFLVGYALNPVGWRDETAGVDVREELVPALAQALGRQSERALRQGLVQGYRVREDSAPVLRGRLREADQLRRRFGLAVPAEVRYDEFTTDVAENQLLRTAAERMLRVPRIEPDAQRRLRRVLALLRDVSPVVPGSRLPAWVPTRLNVRYHTALRLAELVLRGTSVEHTAGLVAVNGFLLDMVKLFEDFVTVALGEELRRYGGRAGRQQTHPLDDACAVRIRPDLVWYRGGRPAAVVDAKYKAERPAGFPDADLYQMLAYCTALDLSHGHLIYARGNERPARYVVRNCGIEIVCHAVDLDQPPSTLLDQLRRVTREIAAGPGG